MTEQGKVVGDVVVTQEEIGGLMAGLLYVEGAEASIGLETKLTDWARAHADTLGKVYTIEVARRVDRSSVYRSN